MMNHTEANNLNNAAAGGAAKALPLNLNTKQLALTGLMAALFCVLGPWALPLPFSPVPISLGFLAVYFVVTVLGMKLGTLSVLIYILLGTVGLPVFTNFSGGIGKLLGPTGGYIIGYIFMALICGYFVDKWPGSLALTAVGMALGSVVCYLFGTVWLAYQANLSFSAALAAGVLPYIPGDLVKMAVGIVTGSQIRKKLVKADLI